LRPDPGSGHFGPDNAGADGGKVNGALDSRN
jgi:hypothetical protein